MIKAVDRSGLISESKDTLDVETVISGHAPPTGAGLLSRYMQYFGLLTQEVKNAIGDGLTMAETIARVGIPEGFAPPPSHPRPTDVASRHHYNVQRTYLALTGTEGLTRHRSAPLRF